MEATSWWEQKLTNTKVKEQTMELLSLTSHSTINLVVLGNKIQNIWLQNNLSFCWIGKLSGKLVVTLLTQKLNEQATVDDTYLSLRK